MKSCITILLILLVLSLFGQNQVPKELGIGFAIASDPYKFEDLSAPRNLYSNIGLTEKWNSGKVYPFFLKPDYGLYHFICLEKTNDYYKILVNDNDIAYIPNDSSFYFKTWDAILMQSTVDRLTKDNPIRKECHKESEIILNNCDIDRLTVQNVIQKDGEYWIQIYFSPDCEDYPDKNTKVKNGWINWRTNEKLLIAILPLC